MSVDIIADDADIDGLHTRQHWSELREATKGIELDPDNRPYDEQAGHVIYTAGDVARFATQANWGGNSIALETKRFVEACARARCGFYITY